MQEIGVLPRQRRRGVGRPRQVHGAVAADDDELEAIGRLRPAEAFGNGERERHRLLWCQRRPLGPEFSERKCLMIL